MASEDKDYKQSALGQRVNELMDDGYDFGEAVKQAMSEGLKDGGSVGIEILFGPKRDNFRYGGDTMGGRNDRSRSSPGPDRSRVSAQQQSNHDRAMAAAQNDGPSFKDKVKSVITNPATQALGGAILTGGINLAVPGALDKLNKARMIKNAIDYAKYIAPDEAIEGELENIQTRGGISPYADGGRVGFFMGGPALEGEALSIYNSMSAYGNDDQTIADRLQALGMYTPPDPTPDAPDAPDQGIINQQLNQGGRDGPQGDFGIFGNLDKSTAKDFNVQTYDEELGDFIDTKITGYKNVNSGLYQDKFGKNLQPAFSNKGQAFGLSGIIAQALGLTPDTVGGYVPGSIKGKYDGITDMFGSIKNFNLKNPFNFFKKQQATIADINAANLKAKQELDAKLAAEAAAAALQQQMQNTGVTGSNYNQAANIAGGGGGNTATYGGQTAREATYDNDPSTGTSQGYSQHYARGGLVTMFKEKR